MDSVALFFHTWRWAWIREIGEGKKSAITATFLL